MKKTLIICAALGIAVAAPLSVNAQAPEKPKKTAAESFKEKDTNADGKLSPEEFAKGANKPENAGKVFTGKDTNKDGFLSLEEYSVGKK